MSQWTENQKKAIEAKGGTVLVSAAAGSGKTAVLVQRIVKKLTDPICPCDVDRLLVITFTNAAAAEIKQRINSEIAALILKNPGDKNLIKQQMLLSNACIGTVHSFCSKILRENFHYLNISANFRVADASELLPLREKAMQNALDSMYSQDDLGFTALLETVCLAKNDDKLADIVEKVYDFSCSVPFFERWIDGNLGRYKDISPICNTAFGKVILAYALEAIDFGIDLLESAILELDDAPQLCAAYCETFSLDLKNLFKIKNLLKKEDWDTIVQNLEGFSFSRLSSAKKCNNPTKKDEVLEHRKKVKEIIEKLKRLFYLSEEEYREDLGKSFLVVRSLFEAVKKFEQEFKSLKAKKNILDFGDLEHLLLKLLVMPSDDGSFVKTEFAQRLAEEFDEILVDEYQDTNEIQDLIFRAVSKEEKNLFIVGDAKQSIYGFRQAKPAIFLKKKETYELFDRKKAVFPAKVILEKNFRSNTQIIQAVNFIFSQLMSASTGGIVYNEEEKMLPGTEALVNNGCQTQKQDQALAVHILQTENLSINQDVAEAKHIAQIINDMIRSGYEIKEGQTTRSATFKDFCVLLRSTSGHIETFKRVLEESAIKVQTDVAENFFKLKEVFIVVSLLRVIDNPLQDIPLLATLTCPIFGFSLNELADIRSKDRQSSVFALLKSMANGGDLHCINFFEKLDEYRSLAKTVNLSRLLYSIYYKLGVLPMVQVMENGTAKVASLKRLLSYVRDYEQTGYNHSLAAFLRLVERLETKQANLDFNSPSSSSEDAVKIMSVHRSKGLEFPICILANCSRKFHKDHEDVLMHTELGLGMKIKNFEKMYLYTTLQREAIALQVQDEETAEELRILYVALTRAKQKLIILNTIKNLPKTLQRLAVGSISRKQIPAYIIKNCQSPSDWILLCALRHPSGRALREMINVAQKCVKPVEDTWEIKILGPEDIADNKVVSVKQTKAKPSSSHDSVYEKQVFAELARRFGHVYAKKDLIGIPAKVSVSELSGSHNSELFEASASPAFLNRRKSSAVERGNAMHYFLQIADFAKARNNLEGYCIELTTSGLLTQKQLRLLNLKKLNRFFQSDLAKRIIASPCVFREYQFTVDIKPSVIKSDLDDALKDELVILQGAVDCAFEEDGEIVIVDYKTDRNASPQKLVNLYSTQLNLYKYALERCMEKKVKQCLVYSLG